MSWEQHRYAVERARDRLRKMVDSINDHCAECGVSTADMEKSLGLCNCPGGKPIYAGATLQGVAGGDDADMLDDVADFLKALEGGRAGDGEGQRFIDDWNKAISTLSNFCRYYALPKPDMIFHPKWRQRMSVIAQRPIGTPLIYAGVRVRFGTLESADVLRP